MATIRQGSELAPVPAIARDMGFALIVAGSLSLAFVGFSGLFTS